MFNQSANRYAGSGGYGGAVGDRYAAISNDAGTVVDKYQKGENCTEDLLRIAETIYKMRENRLGQFESSNHPDFQMLNAEKINTLNAIRQDNGQTNPIQVLKALVARATGGVIPAWLDNLKI